MEGVRKAVNSQVKQVCFQGTVWRLKNTWLSLLSSKYPKNWFYDSKTKFCTQWQMETLMRCLPWQDVFELSLDDIVYVKGIEWLQIKKKQLSKRRTEGGMDNLRLYLGKGLLIPY